MFDGPGRAVQCGCSVVTVAERSRIGVRAGVHIGECDPTACTGLVPDISAALADAAVSGEVLRLPDRRRSRRRLGAAILGLGLAADAGDRPQARRDARAGCGVRARGGVDSEAGAF